MKIQSLCFLHSRDIFNGFLNGKTVGEICVDVMNKTGLKSENHFRAGLRVWIQELGFDGYKDLKTHIFEFGMPSGKGHITKVMLENQRIAKQVITESNVTTGSATAKISEKKHGSDQAENTEKKKTKNKLFQKNVDINSSDGATDNGNGLLPAKKKEIKSLYERIKDKRNRK